MIALRPCPSCARHARVSETTCPFCGTRFEKAFRTFTSPQTPAARLSRAALFAVGAGGIVAACGGSAQPAYGAVPPASVDCDAEPAACEPTGSVSDAGPDVATTPLPEASSFEIPEAAASDAADAGVTTDAAEEPCVATSCPLYGLGPLPCGC
jgi:hypothetical protein